MERIERLYDFITSDKKFQELDMLLQMDIIISFFIHCYHLKDWLIKSGMDRAIIENFIQETDTMGICRDLTNSTKHLGLREKSRTSNKVINFDQLDMPSAVCKGYSPFSKKLAEMRDEKYIEPIEIITTREGSIDCKSFMKICMKEWQNFFENNKLKNHFKNHY
jgi:hypothetical protein